MSWISLLKDKSIPFGLKASTILGIIFGAIVIIPNSIKLYVIFSSSSGFLTLLSMISFIQIYIAILAFGIFIVILSYLLLLKKNYARIILGIISAIFLLANVFSFFINYDELYLNSTLYLFIKIALFAVLTMYLLLNKKIKMAFNKK